jgi:hypothetical protein
MRDIRPSSDLRQFKARIAAVEYVTQGHESELGQGQVSALGG